MTCRWSYFADKGPCFCSTTDNISAWRGWTLNVSAARVPQQLSIQPLLLGCHSNLIYRMDTALNSNLSILVIGFAAEYYGF